MTIIEFTHEYVLVTCGAEGCDQTFGMHQRFYDQTKRTGEGWYCPKGHSRRWAGKTTEQRLREVEAQVVHTKDQLAAAAREAEEMRVRLLRDRQRFANGVCPCCNRSFTNVMRHMKTQHPDYDPTRLDAEPTITFRCSCGRGFDTLRGLKVHQGHNRTEGWEQPDAPRWLSHLTLA